MSQAIECLDTHFGNCEGEARTRAKLFNPRDRFSYCDEHWALRTDRKTGNAPTGPAISECFDAHLEQCDGEIVTRAALYCDNQNATYCKDHWDQRLDYELEKIIRRAIRY